MTAPETTILVGDCRDVLRTLASDSVHTVVTSPPYYGLRDYGTAQWDGGDESCDHMQCLVPSADDDPGIRCSTLEGGKRTTTAQASSRSYRDTCGKCGARRIDRQIGLEATPDAWLAEMVVVFREVRRVLRPDGTLWLNMGDSYASGEVGRHDALAARNGDAGITYKSLGEHQQARMQRARPPGYKTKDLMLMPARLALALQADGWWVRSDIIWHKPNPMPESCTDRPTSSYEHVFLLSRSARYFYDADAVREAQVEPDRMQVHHLTRGPSLADGKSWRGDGDTRGYNPAGRNARNIWTIATETFSGAHFATYPTELVSRCIRAGTSERGCCAACGAPWVRTTSVVRDQRVMLREQVVGSYMGSSNRTIEGVVPSYASPEITTTGWRASCRCDADTVPCTVLDPFGGSGTTGLVAHRLQRNAILIELNPDYAEMARHRITTDAPLFTAWAPAVTDPQDERMADLFAMAAD